MWCMFRRREGLMAVWRPATNKVHIRGSLFCTGPAHWALVHNMLVHMRTRAHSLTAKYCVLSGENSKYTFSSLVVWLCRILSWQPRGLEPDMGQPRPLCRKEVWRVILFGIPLRNIIKHFCTDMCLCLLAGVYHSLMVAGIRKNIE